jgi:hypothetical protein
MDWYLLLCHRCLYLSLCYLLNADIYQTNIKLNPFQSRLQHVTVKYLNFAFKYGGDHPTL